jgi:N-acetylglucosaminyl-diphospho-decaprenol L-rhamnosyltransferase
VSDIDVATVIVTYMSAELTIKCLASLDEERRRHATTKIRVVVVDNASGDLPQIERAVQQRGWSSWVTLVLAPRNGGFAYGNNLGIRSAYEARPPDYVYLLNPDTEVRPSAIAVLVEFLESHPSIGIAGSSFETEDGKPWRFAFRFPTLFSEIDYAVQLGMLSRCLSRWAVARTMDAVDQPTDWICGASMMIRPAVLFRIGCLDENFFLYFEETEFCFRAYRAGFPTWYVPESRVMHIIGKSTRVEESSRSSSRLPGYWFDSRSRYFVITHGVAKAALIDIVAISFSVLGWLRGKLSRRASIPNYIRDLWAHSVLLPRNRPIPPIKSYFPIPPRDAHDGEFK